MHRNVTVSENIEMFIVIYKLALPIASRLCNYVEYVHTLYFPFLLITNASLEIEGFNLTFGTILRICLYICYYHILYVTYIFMIFMLYIIQF